MMAGISGSGFSSVMVHVDLGVGMADRVTLARGLADRFACRLIGVTGRDFFATVAGDDMVGSDPELIRVEEENAASDLSRAEVAFRDAAGPRSETEWRGRVCPPLQFVCKQARAADLIIVGRNDPSVSLEERMSVDPGDLVMSAGRPVLLVPPHTKELLGKRAVIAWKDTREARRAMLDGLPLLRQATEVFVVEVGGRGCGMSDVCDYLVISGVHARALRPSIKKGHVAEILLGLVKEEGADLLVAGAYGHSRVREWIFGGVTRELLQGANVCCLLSH